MSERAPLSVGVLVDLELRPEAGGHVKCWERIAEAAAGDERVDLTVHFLGSSFVCRDLASNVRLVTHAPVLPTTQLRFIEAGPSVTDLAPMHHGVDVHLRRYDLLHTTYAWFALSRTALARSRRSGVPLVTSLHTDVPGYTRVFTERAIDNVLGRGSAGRFLCEQLRLPERVGAYMQRGLESYLTRCSWVMASDEEGEAIARTFAGERVSLLRRGVDKSRFHPRAADRGFVEATYGLPRGIPLLLYVGRVDASKSPVVLAEAVRSLEGRGLPVHAVFVGAGDLRERVRAVAGSAATCVGPLPQAALPRLYASADLFVLPSTTELRPNVAIEAKSCGLPVILSSKGGARQVVRHGEDGLLVDGADPELWADAVERLLRNPQRRAAMSRRARKNAEAEVPSWSDVLNEDLLPVWREVTRNAVARRRTS